MMGLGGSMSFGGLRSGMMNSAMNDPLNQGVGQMSGAGMDPMGSLRQHSDFATRFQSNPTVAGSSGPFGGGGMTSWGPGGY